MFPSVTGQISLIAVGGNQTTPWGDPAQTIRRALSQVATLSDGPAVTSPLYATPAFPAGSGPAFVNAAIAIDTTQSPDALLGQLHRVEAAAGRTRDHRWGPRTLDLDLIAVGDMVLPDRAMQTHWRRLAPADQARLTPDRLILPHPRLQDRAFVLVPLRDIAPDWVHPILHRTVSQMCAALPHNDVTDVRPINP